MNVVVLAANWGPDRIGRSMRTAKIIARTGCKVKQKKDTIAVSWEGYEFLLLGSSLSGHWDVYCDLILEKKEKEIEIGDSTERNGRA